MSSIRKEEVLKLLREENDYVSGQQLCEGLGISRTAVWKVINQLKQEGYVIDAVQNKGYRLSEDSDVLSQKELESSMTSDIMGRSLLYLETVDSTNNEAKRRAELSAPHGFLVAAGRQEQGKGRRGRSWESPAGKDIYMTLLLRPSFAPEKASMITLVAALSTAQAIMEQTGLKALIKWPNDIVVNKKKVVGILTEMTLEDQDIQYLVCGIGINANQTEYPEELKDKATSLFLEGKKQVKRAPLMAKCMERFEKNYEIFLRREDLSELMEAYNSLLVSLDLGVRVLDPKGEFEGVSRGINEKGQLLVEKKDKTVEAVYAGEVSVRGIYGYV